MTRVTLEPPARRLGARRQIDQRGLEPPRLAGQVRERRRVRRGTARAVEHPFAADARHTRERVGHRAFDLGVRARPCQWRPGQQPRQRVEPLEPGAALDQERRAPDHRAPLLDSHEPRLEPGARRGDRVHETGALRRGRVRIELEQLLPPAGSGIVPAGDEGGRHVS